MTPADVRKIQMEEKLEEIAELKAKEQELEKEVEAEGGSIKKSSKE